MKRFLLFLAIFIFISANPTFAAEKKPAFGFTNVSQAMMLHPLMAKYRIKEGRFAKTALKKSSEENLDSRRKAIIEKQAELQKEQKSLTEKLHKLDQELSQALSSLNVQYSNKKVSSPGSHSDQYNKEKNSIETKFWQKRKELQKQMTMLQEEFGKLSNENELLHLTSQAETDKIFAMMIDDVYEAVDVVSKHYKIDFVFNSSFSVERTPVNQSFTPANPMGEFFNRSFNRDASEVLFEHGEDGTPPLFTTIDFWCACQRWAFRNTVDQRLDKMILKGGLDMTPAVVDFVYQKHKVSAGHRDVIQEFFKQQSKQ